MKQLTIPRAGRPEKTRVSVVWRLGLSNSFFRHGADVPASAVAKNAVPIWTALAPACIMSLMLALIMMPPAAITGDFKCFLRVRTLSSVFLSGFRRPCTRHHKGFETRNPLRRFHLRTQSTAWVSGNLRRSRCQTFQKVHMNQDASHAPVASVLSCIERPVTLV
jgi:hypothetical protein